MQEKDTGRAQDGRGIDKEEGKRKHNQIGRGRIERRSDNVRNVFYS